MNSKRGLVFRRSFLTTFRKHLAWPSPAAFASARPIERIGKWILLAALVVAAVAWLSSPSFAVAQEREAEPNPQAETTQPLSVGDAAPDFALQGLGDDPVVLSQRFVGDDADATDVNGKPVVLVFSRAHW